MDLIAGLSKAMGVDSKQAEALAGAALATVKGQMAEGEPEGAKKLDAAVPELGGWLATAKAMVAEKPAAAPEASGFGALLGMAGSGVGNQLLGAVAGKEAQDAALFAALLSKLGLDAQKAAMAAPFVLDFLKSRLDPVWMDRIRQAAPFLTGAPAGGAAGAAGMLGNLFK